METKPPATSLPGIRTLAGDLAATKPAATKPSSSTPPPKKAPAEHFVYKAPSGKQQTAQPTPKPEPATKAAAPATAPTTPRAAAPTLKPLSAPKRVTEPTIIVENEDAAAATIIRDTKRNRFHLLPAISSSLGDWFKGIKERYFTKKAPRYTVPEATRRKGVIQKATSKTGKIAAFDTSSLQERIRARRDRAIPKTPVTIWTANTEPGYPLLEAPDNAPISVRESITNVTVVPRKASAPAAPAVVTAPAPREPAPLVIGETEPIVPVALPPEPTPEPEPAPVQVPASSPEILVPQPPLIVKRQPEPELITPPVTKLKPANLREWLFSLNTNFISLSVASLVGAMIIVVLIGYHWFTDRPANLTISTSPSHQAILAEKVQLLYSASLETTEMESLVVGQLFQSPYEIFELAFSFDQPGNTLLPPNGVMAGLGWSNDPILSRIATAIHFGALNRQTPFIVLRVSDPVSARGSLLDWETTLFSDLTPIFNLIGTPRTQFVDAIIDTYDARLLRGTQNENLLVYAIKNNLVIITTTEAALSELLTHTNK